MGVARQAVPACEGDDHSLSRLPAPRRKRATAFREYGVVMRVVRGAHAAGLFARGRALEDLRHAAGRISF